MAHMTDRETSEDHRAELMSKGVIGLTIGVAVIGAEALVMSPILEDIGAGLDASPGKIGIAVAAYGFTLAVASPIVGLVGHRIERLTLMMLGLALFVLATAWCGLAQGPISLICARALCGISAAAYLPTCYAFVGDAVPYESRAKVMGRIMFGWSISLVVGVPLGGVIGELYGWRFSFLAIAVVGLLALFMIFRLRKLANRLSKYDVIERSVQWPFPRPVWAIFGVTLFNMLGFYSVYTYFGAAVRAAQNVGSAGASAYVFVYGIGLAFSTLRGDILDRIGKVRLLGAALLLLVPVFALQAVAIGRPVVLFPVLLFWGVLQGAILTGTATVLTHEAGPTKGMATSLNSSLTYFAVALGALLGGVVIEGRLGFVGICMIASGASFLSWAALHCAKLSTGSATKS